MKIVFLGLDIMWFPMAGHLAKKECCVTVYNRTEAKSKQWIGLYFGYFYKNLLNLTSSDIVCTCLGEDQDIESVQIDSGFINKLKSGSLLIDHTTTSPAMAKILKKNCKTRNIGVIDAPISGGQVGAENGILSIMVGRNSKNYDRTLPILKCYGKNIVHIGSTGSGQMAKTINQICSNLYSRTYTGSFRRACIWLVGLVA